MKNELIKLADHLDKKGLHKEANYLDVLMKRAQDKAGVHEGGDLHEQARQRKEAAKDLQGTIMTGFAGATTEDKVEQLHSAMVALLGHLSMY